MRNLQAFFFSFWFWSGSLELLPNIYTCLFYAMNVSIFFDGAVFFLTLFLKSSYYSLPLFIASWKIKLRWATVHLLISTWWIQSIGPQHAKFDTSLFISMTAVIESIRILFAILSFFFNILEHIFIFCRSQWDVRIDLKTILLLQALLY